MLYGGSRGIRPAHLDYYELMTGGLGARVARREAPAEPRASVVVPIGDDRGLLMGTLLSLARQELDELEIVCADCSQGGYARRVVEAIAGRDGRFRLIAIEGRTRSAAIAAGVAETNAPVIAFVLPGDLLAAGHVGALCDALSGSGAEMALCGAPANAARARGVDGSGTVSLEGARAEVATARGFSLSCCAFDAGFLGGSGAIAAMGAHDGALSLALGALCRASKAAVADAPLPRAASPRTAFCARSVSDRECYQSGVEALDEAVASVRGLGPDAERAARCLVVRLLRNDLVRFQGSDEGEHVFQDVRERVEELCEIWETPRASYCNQDDLLALELALRSTYEDSLRREVGRLRDRSGALAGKLSETRSSRSYRLGKAIVGVSKKIMPSGIVRRLRG